MCVCVGGCLSEKRIFNSARDKTVVHVLNTRKKWIRFVWRKAGNFFFFGETNWESKGRWQQ